MAEAFNYVFTALRGRQAGRDYYVVMCPLKLIPRIFLFDEEELPPELRAQRTLNRARIPDIANYIVENPDGYAFSSIAAAIDGPVDFQPLDTSELGRNVGRLIIPMTARFLINDGQHRQAAIEEALKERPELADETISVVFFVDQDLERSQQLFADLNKHAVQPTKSLGILYDQRDPLAGLARELAQKAPLFKGLTELEKTTISNRSIKLFTLSAIYQATGALLDKRKNDPIDEHEKELAFRYWSELTKVIPEWQLVIKREVNSAELRQDYVHVHAVTLHSLGIAGHALFESRPGDWPQQLQCLRRIDWSRSNVAIWEGRVMSGGHMSKSRQNVQGTAAFLKKTLGLTLTHAEQQAEEHFVSVRQETVSTQG